MAINKVKENNHVSYGTVIYTVDSASELSSVPTDIAPGSTCFVIDESKTYILNGQGEWKVYSSGGGGGGGGGVDDSIIAEEYDNTSTYSVGDYVFYNDNLYICTDNISSPEPWNSNHWNQTNITDSIPSISQDGFGGLAISGNNNIFLNSGIKNLIIDNYKFDFTNTRIGQLNISNTLNPFIHFETHAYGDGSDTYDTYLNFDNILDLTLILKMQSGDPNSLTIPKQTTPEESGLEINVQRRRNKSGGPINMFEIYSGTGEDLIVNTSDFILLVTGFDSISWAFPLSFINKSSYTEVSDILAAGSTSITLSNAAITTTSTLEFYTDIYGVNPTSVTTTTGAVTLTFPAQASNLGVKVRVS